MKAFFLFFILIVTMNSFALDLSKKEKEWIATNPKITAGAGDDWAPFNFKDRTGKFGGITEDYLQLIEKKTGLKIQRRVANWGDILESFKKGEIDFLPAALYQKEREKYGDFIKEHIKLRDFIYVRSDDATITKFQDLNGKTLVRKVGYAVLDPYLKFLKNVKVIEVNTTLEMINAVYNKQADAFVEGQANVNYILKENMIGGFKSIAQSVSAPTTAHFLVKKDSPILYSILEKALADISVQQHHDILQKWISFSGTQKIKSVLLSEAQKEWIVSHPLIRVGVEKDWAPYDFIDHEGEYQGIARGYLEYIAQKTGLEFVYYPDDWSILLSKMKQKELDLLPALYYSKSRSEYIEFTQSYLQIPEYLYTLKSQETVEDINTLNNKKIAAVKGYSLIEWLEENYPQIIIVQKATLLEALQAVQTGEVFGFIGDEGSAAYTIEQYMLRSLKLNNIIEKRDPINVYMGARKDWDMLASIISKVFEDVSYETHRSIVGKWIGSDLSKKGKNVKLSLDNKEKKWLQSKPVIRYSEVNWKPLSIIEKSKMSGIMGDYLQYVSDVTGLEFQYVPANSWKDVLDMFTAGEIDLVPGVGGSKEELALGEVSDAYAHYPMVIITNEHIAYIKDLKDIAHKKISVPKFYTSYNYIKENYPDAEILATDSIAKSLKKVATGEADVFVGHIAPALYHISQLGLSNLKIAGEANFEFQHRYLISKKYPELLSIVNKSFATITQQERDKIYANWVHTEVAQSFDYTLLIKIAIAVLALFAIFFYYNRKIMQQKVFVQTLLDAQEQIVVTKHKSSLINVNRAFLEFFECGSLEEFIQKYKVEAISECFVRTDDNEYLSARIDGVPWTDYVLLHSHKTHKVQMLKEDEIYIFTVTVAKLPGKKDLRSAVFTDITDLENAKKEMGQLYQQTRDSIEYASLIQHSLIPEEKYFQNYFSDFFSIWNPKDIVGGDIYLFEELRDDSEYLLMVIDGTGHGVPGAFVTMLVKAIERQIVSKIKHSDERVSPANLLGVFNRSMKHLLKQESVDSVSNAGFDGAILYFNKKEGFVKYAGAQLPLFYFDKEGVLQTIKGSRQSVGYKTSRVDFEFEEHILETFEGMEIFVTTDGYIDQNGGDKGFPFGKKSLKKILAKTYGIGFEKRKEELIEALAEYQGEQHQNDDITVVGVKI